MNRDDIDAVRGLVDAALEAADLLDAPNDPISNKCADRLQCLAGVVRTFVDREGAGA